MACDSTGKSAGRATPTAPRTSCASSPSCGATKLPTSQRGLQGAPKPRGCRPRGEWRGSSCAAQPNLHPEQQAYLDRLHQADTTVAAAYRLAQEFAAMARQRGGARLDAWLADVDGCDVPALRRFATGLRADLEAVRAGLTESWSNGPTEGFVHKRKLVKRQAYGRAGFAVLRQRVLLAA